MVDNLKKLLKDILESILKKCSYIGISSVFKTYDNEVF